MGSENRPYKYGPEDRREYIVQDSEVSLVAINVNGNPVFVGRAKTGTPLTKDRWQLKKITYDTSGGVTRIEWAEEYSMASTDFKFFWSSVDDLTITNITKSSPGVVSVSDVGVLTDGDKIVIQDVEGMTEVNFDGSTLYTVANVDDVANTFELLGIDTSAYTNYTSGGIVKYGEVVNYDYS